MRRSQPASQDSEDADTVATADCSHLRNGVERQARPDAHAHQVAAVGGSSTDGGRRVRARTAPRMNDDASSSSQLPGGSPGGRPTAAERAEALSVIRQMKEAEPPILSRRGAPPKPNVVACAIALYRGEVFESDADALRIFGAAETTMVRRDWVEDKLARFAPAGFNTPGELLPSYRLDRPEGSTTGFDPELPSYVHLDALRARFAPSQAALDGSEEAAEAEEYWLTGHLREMARRESEFVAWAAVHAAERDAQHEQLAAEGLEFYWALGSCIGRKPKWELRNAECLEGDRSRTIGSGELGVDEPLLMYREFRPFTGDVLKAEQFFGADILQRDYDWLDSERVRLDATRAPVVAASSVGRAHVTVPASGATGTSASALQVMPRMMRMICQMCTVTARQTATMMVPQCTSSCSGMNSTNASRRRCLRKVSMGPSASARNMS